MNATIAARPDSRKTSHRPTLGDLMRRKGPTWAADCIARRYQIRHSHAALIVGMLGLGRERGR